ncbi:MAG: membrane protein insertion efficiency factor YidD [Alphaproteobacteria bacterium]|nr:membrane protein insertion efficiency factor YidD [Alphaproteobacteria bacterium]MCB9794346.1 membrane protein insertion efficiency factor YidD [Alphaproteobacteria bacterium]
MILALLATLSAAPLPECRELAGREGAPLEAPEPLVGTVRVTAWLALQGWQRLLSPGNGASCQLYPTCSGYAKEALQRYGPLRGAVLAFERVASPHEHWTYTPCQVRGRVYYYDPVSANVGGEAW